MRSENKIMRTVEFSSKKTGEADLLLAPLELPRPANSLHGAEIRIADRQSYYLELRSKEPSAVGDQDVSTVVLVTDFMLDTSGLINTGRQLLLAPTDSEGQGPELFTGQSWNAQGLIESTVPMNLRISASDVQSDRASVKVSYDVPDRPNPSIRPWHTEENSWWQSPDIEVRNDRNAANPELFNKFWPGHENVLVAKITNNGKLDAPQVHVDFFIKDFTVGPTDDPNHEPLTSLVGGDTKDVPSGATVEFQTLWTAPVSEQPHYCVVAVIKPYQLPSSPDVLEADLYDNTATE
jgi:hypothetical protein